MRYLPLLFVFAALFLVSCTDETATPDVDAQPPPAVQETTGTIVEVAASTSNLTTLVDALEQADLVSLLGSEGPFTVLAPTNDAFEALGQATLGSLMDEGSSEALRETLRAHVVEGRLASDDLRSMGSVTTVAGTSFDVEAVEEAGVTLYVGGEEVLQTDIEASNGVIHVLGGVLMSSE